MATNEREESFVDRWRGRFKAVVDPDVELYRALADKYLKEPKSRASKKGQGSDKRGDRDRPQGITYAISNTGPLISAFQSDSFDLVTRIFPKIFISTACLQELKRHGWENKIARAAPRLTILELKASEKKRALSIARQIAGHSSRGDSASEHAGESQAIVLALRSEHRDDVLLLDERTAREVAKQQTGITLSGFPGVLLLAVQAGHLTPEELRRRLEVCKEKGTHYGSNFIETVYHRALTGGGSS